MGLEPTTPGATDQCSTFELHSPQIDHPLYGLASEMSTSADPCERGESNPHPLRGQILSLVRLPVPPLSRGASYLAARSREGKPRWTQLCIGQKQSLWYRRLRSAGCGADW